MSILIFGGGGIAEGIQKIIGGTILEKQECDITSYGQVLFKVIEYKPQVVINCAGVSHPRSIKDIEWDHLEDEFNINMKGSFLIAKQAAQMGVRTMIFIASVAGMYGKPNHAGYSASKAGVISLVQSLGMEGHNAYAISPGRVDTPMRQKDYPQDLPNTRLEPEEIGSVVKDILDDKYEPGDNIVVRRIGFETAPIKVSKGEPWRNELRVGQPVTL